MQIRWFFVNFPNRLWPARPFFVYMFYLQKPNQTKNFGHSFWMSVDEFNISYSLIVCPPGSQPGGARGHNATQHSQHLQWPGLFHPWFYANSLDETWWWTIKYNFLLNQLHIFSSAPRACWSGDEIKPLVTITSPIRMQYIHLWYNDTIHLPERNPLRWVEI